MKDGNRDKRIFRRGDIWEVDFGDRFNSCLYSGRRPCVIISNYKCNSSSGMLTVIPCTSRLNRVDFPTHVLMEKDKVTGFLEKDSVVAAEQLTTVDKRRAKRKIGYIQNQSELMNKIDDAVKLQLEFVEVM